MTPYFEPMKGEVTGVTTTALVERHGPILGRFMNSAGNVQFVQFSDGAVYDSFEWYDGTWLPWARRITHSFERLARHVGVEVECA